MKLAPIILAVSVVVGSAVFAQNRSQAPRSGHPLVSGRMTQGFNVPWSANRTQRHTGVDISSPAGTRVFAIKDGTIEKTGFLGGDYGYYAVVRNHDGTVSGYLHIRELRLTGRGPHRVKKGVGFADVFKDHLHLNDCFQVAGCQHGAHPNPTFTAQMGNLTRYYREPQVTYPR